MSNVNSRGDKSNYYTPAPGNKAPSGFWGGFGGNKTTEKNTGKLPRNPGLDEQRNSRKSHDCPFCG